MKKVFNNLHYKGNLNMYDAFNQNAESSPIPPYVEDSDDIIIPK